jgi:hypothetical protein
MMAGFTKSDQIHAAALGVRIDDIKIVPDRPVTQQNVRRSVITAEDDAAFFRNDAAFWRGHCGALQRALADQCRITREWRTFGVWGWIIAGAAMIALVIERNL